MMLHKLFQSVASLKFTVILLALSILLVFTGTVAQLHKGIWTVQEEYFHSFFVLGELVPIQWAGEPVAIRLPLPGGYLLAGLLLLNLLAYTFRDFRMSVRKVGIAVLHAGIALLLVGQILTSQLAVETRMSIREGESTSWAEDVLRSELVLIDPAREEGNEVAIAADELLPERTIADPRLPLTVRVDGFYENSVITHGRDPRATRGTGLSLRAQSQPPALEANVDRPAAYVTLLKGEQVLGTWMVATVLQPQRVDMPDGSILFVDLRPRRYYKPYTVRLIDFHRELYPASSIPKSFSSRIHFTDPSAGIDRDVLISMNHPFRHNDETFFQASFAQDERGTVLQVVNNPAWMIPYIGCVIVAAGMMYHFIWGLARFAARRSRETSPVEDIEGELVEVAPSIALGESTGSAPPRLAAMLAPILAVVLGAVLIAASWMPRNVGPAGFDLRSWGELPVLHNGRIKPIDTLARSQLMYFSNRQSVEFEDDRLGAVEWYMLIQADPARANEVPIFRIDNPGIRGLLESHDDQKKLYSLRDLQPFFNVLLQEAQKAQSIPAESQTTYQQKIAQLGNQLMRYASITSGDDAMYPALDASGPKWRTMPILVHQAGNVIPDSPWIAPIYRLREAYRDGQPDVFNSAIAQYTATLEQHPGALEGERSNVLTRSRVEAAFNRADPFFGAMWLYIIVFVLANLSLLVWRRPLGRAALALGTLTVLYHAFGLGISMYLHGKPPVTNLYASAIFVGFGAVLLGLLFEKIFRNGLGTIAASVCGFASLLVAHYLDAGDNFRPVVAVLDTNLWLIVHVLTITLGYSATFLAGFLGIIYIIRGVFTRSLTEKLDVDLGRMMYGTVCFAMLLSFVGTLTGGIWADQSWGRFWGWDPKENGALMIVLINAVILHARWCQWVGNRGVAVLAVVGNIITAWAWFGVNMLGKGLHSYGFMEQGVWALAGFATTQILLIALGVMPREMWRSFAARPRPPQPADPMPEA